MPFSIVRNDITKVKADAIVDTANPDVAIGGGVDTAIYKAAGEDKLLEARKQIGYLAPGEVGITPAFNLDARFIIHSSGPLWEGGDKGEADLLRKCYDKSLSLAADKGCESIAFPLLATGTYGFPKELGLQIAIDAFTKFLTDHEMEITLVVFGDDAYHISGRIFDDVKSFIDDEYVGGALDAENYYESMPVNRMMCMKAAAAQPFVDDEDFDLEALYGEEESEESDYYEADMMFGASKEKSLDEELKEMYTDSFAKHLKQLINKKGLKNSEVYAAANISKQYFSKLLKGQVNPSKEKVLALAVGLRLNLDEAVDFLGLAGYALSPISQTDVIVKYYIVHKEYNVLNIDVTLFEFGLDPLSKG